MKHITAVCVAASFIVASLYCCSFSSIELKNHKHACCDTKAGHGQKSSTDCPHCNSSFNAESRAHDADQFQLIAPVLSFTMEHGISHVPVVLGKSLFINGPPGPLNIVPLYIKSPSLRI